VLKFYFYKKFPLGKGESPTFAFMTAEYIAVQLQLLQDDICQQLELLDGGTFKEDIWHRPEGGGGRTRVLQGVLIEKGGVNFSAVHGPMPETIAQSMGLHHAHFFATGVSIVLHPRSPMAPIIHMNVRFFETDTGRWWFGGGIDLTPHYVYPEDARWFHHQLKTVCDSFDLAFYSNFKAQADDYFFIKHRGETRGVGGIFYDYLDDAIGLTRERLFDFSLALGRVFAPIYAEMVHRAQARTWGEAEHQWQMVRRGRYAEFNLVWDRGTKFGLETGGRTESILMSLPPQAMWVYNVQPDPGSPEAETLSWLRKGVDWLHV
jgi:coproporphyrinogen III oxidase